MRKGCKHLRIASVLVIALGVISIIGIRMILGSDVAAGELTGTQLEGALGGLIGLYAFNGFKILAGLIGLALSCSFASWYRSSRAETARRPSS